MPSALQAIGALFLAIAFVNILDLELGLQKPDKSLFVKCLLSIFNVEKKTIYVMLFPISASSGKV